MSQMRKYYEEQLKFLRIQGKAFAQRHPKLAPFLGEGDIDPDIERLLEGFAFISGKLWHKIEDAYPELSEQLLEFVAPNYLKPLPSCSILEFIPSLAQAANPTMIARSTRIDARKKAQHYFFSTCYDTEVSPMRLSNVSAKREYDELILRLDFTMLGAANLLALPKGLRLYFATDLSSAYWWYYLFLQQVRQTIFSSGDKIEVIKNLAIKAVGLKPEESLLPFHTEQHQVTQHLLEYYSFPEKFMFVDLKNLPWHVTPYAQNFSLEFYLKVPERLKLSATTDTFKINCTPIMNIWEHHAAPIMHDHSQSRYWVNVPETEIKGAVHSVQQLDAWSHATRTRHEYVAAYQCPYPIETRNCYQVYLEEHAVNSIPQVYVELWEEGLTHLDKITIVPKILAYQPEVFLDIQQGDIIESTQNLLACGYKNITPLSMPVYPPLGRSMTWHLLSYLALAYKNLDELDNLKTLLLHHDFAAQHGDQYQGVAQKLAESVHQSDIQEAMYFERGEAIRGYKSVLSVKEAAFINVGELYLFGSVLAKILADRAAFNSFHELEIKSLSTQINLRWPARL
jgi:type VI secretion system protein ImpG